MSRIEENAKVLQTNFGELGLEVECIKWVESPLGDTFYFNLKHISDYNEKHIKTMLETISVYHHLDMTFSKTKEAHFKVFIQYANGNIISLVQCLSEVNFREIAIGKTDDNKVMSFDFNKTPHLLIGGTTGSGKSVLLHDILCGIYVTYGTNKDVNRLRKAEVIIIDPKGSELNIYKGCFGTLYIDDVNEAIEQLKVLCIEMDRRYKALDTYKDIDTYVVIDELADLMLRSRFEVEESIVRLAQKGRACGIHLIVATQRPTADVVSGLIKANMPYRIALKTASVRDSVVILDHKGAEALNGCGDCIIKNGLFERRCQVALADEELKAKIVSECRVRV